MSNLPSNPWRPVARGALTAAAFAMLLVAVPATSAPVCVDPEKGIGGTGAAGNSGAIGGTGAPAGAIGGTGAVAGAVGGTGTMAGAIGGTGAPQGAIGGTGAVAGAVGGTGAVAGAIGGTGAPQGAIGGTGAVAGAIDGTGAAQGAIGGTGAKTNGGIGGTGHHIADGMGGTGIVGTITGFASVCVNGLEVHYADSTPMTVNGVPASASQLAVGQVVAIEAVPSQRGLSAQRISVLHAVVGPITEGRASHGVLRVMGQPVRLSGATRIAGAGGMVSQDALQPGAVVQVSGYRNARGEIVATRVQSDDGLAGHSSIGQVARPSNRGFDVSGTQVEGRAAALRDGEEVLVRGRWEDGRLRASDVRAEPTLAAIEGAKHVVLEGLVRGGARGELSVGGIGVRLSPDTRMDSADRNLQEDQRVKITGRIDSDRRIRAERIEIERDVDSGSSRSGSGHRGGSDSRVDGDDDRSADDQRGSDGNDAARSASDDRSPGSGSSDDRSSGSSGSAERSSGRDGSDRSGSGGSDRNLVDRADRSDRPERINSSDRVEKLERVDKVERPEKVERIEKVERPEKVERIESVERPEKVERIESVERPEKVERIEKIERPDSSGSGSSKN